MHILFYGHRMEITLAKWEMDAQRNNEKEIEKKFKKNFKVIISKKQQNKTKKTKKNILNRSSKISHSIKMPFHSMKLLLVAIQRISIEFNAAIFSPRVRLKVNMI